MEVSIPEELTILAVPIDLRREGGSFVLAVPVSLKSQLRFVLAVADLASCPFFFSRFSSPQSYEFVFVFVFLFVFMISEREK